MCEHEKAKNDCVRVLEYYGIFADTEYRLHTDERIDVVGYSKDRRSPSIGIEVECSSTFQHDSQKLVKVPSIEWRFVLTDDRDTLSLGEVINVNNLPIFVYPLHELDFRFEKKIREITNQNNKPWYNRVHEYSSFVEDENSSILDRFMHDLQEQSLDIGTAKDIIFRAAMGGIHVGYYRDEKGIGTQFHGDEKLPREIHYLTAKNVIFEDRPGKNYTEGRQSIYYITKEGHELTKEIVRERVSYHISEIEATMEEFGQVPFLISLLGNINNGVFVWRTDVPPTNGPSLTGTEFIDLRGVVEVLNVSPELLYASYLMSNTRIFAEIERKIFERLVEKSLGTTGKAFTSRGDVWGQRYTVPVFTILQNIDFPLLKRKLDFEKVQEFATYALMNPQRTRMELSDYSLEQFHKIGVDRSFVYSLLTETFNHGITSKPTGQKNETVAIYNQEQFKQFCESRMKEILSDLSE